MFTGRLALLQKMRHHLLPNIDRKARFQQSVFVLHGIGGSGKSEVAIKFAEENRDRLVRSRLVFN